MVTPTRLSAASNEVLDTTKRLFDHTPGVQANVERFFAPRQKRVTCSAWSSRLSAFCASPERSAAGRAGQSAIPIHRVQPRVPTPE
jgi:hypothetical protein